MNKLHLTAAAVLLSAVSPAIAKEQPVTFTHEGVTYRYTVTPISENRRVIEGEATPGAPFRLVVVGNRVFGTANGNDVSFRVDQAKGKVRASSVVVASR